MCRNESHIHWETVNTFLVTQYGLIVLRYAAQWVNMHTHHLQSVPHHHPISVQCKFILPKKCIGTPQGLSCIGGNVTWPSYIMWNTKSWYHPKDTENILHDLSSDFLLFKDHRLLNISIPIFPSVEEKVIYLSSVSRSPLHIQKSLEVTLLSLSLYLLASLTSALSKNDVIDPQWWNSHVTVVQETIWATYIWFKCMLSLYFTIFNTIIL